MSSTGPAARNRTSAPAGNGSDGAPSSIVLGPRDRLIGQLYIEGDLRVAGTVEGGLEVTGSVEIADGGRVIGPITARDRLVVGKAGSLIGDVRVARLVVQDGATFSGKVSMGNQVEAPPKPAEPVKDTAALFKPPDVKKAPEGTRPAEAVKPISAVKQPHSVKPAQAARPPQVTSRPDTKGKRR
ncbi:MAG: bactofilin family protein [Candidatus Dormibacteraceae bacterium]